jgi:hypothetical protein
MNETPFNLFRYIVYNKGVNDDFEKCNVDEIVNLPNIGRCDHTYLYHIVHNYNNLNYINVFFPGCLNIEFKKNIATKILYKIIHHKKAIIYGNKVKNIQSEFNNFTLDYWSSTDAANKNLNPENKTFHAKLRPYGKWYKYMFGNKKASWYCLYGIFSINRLDIIKHNKQQYIQLLNAVSVHSNPEVGHYIERSWAAIFNPTINTLILDAKYL